MDQIDIKALTPFTFREFNDLYERLRPVLDEKTKSGRGRPPSISSKSALLLFLIFLKHGVTVECLKTMTGLSSTVIKSTITKMIFLGRRVASILIRFPNPIEIMKLQDVQDFPDCKFVVDASHVRIERPRDQRVQREFYSGKHKFHEVKFQTLNTSSGEAVHVAVAKGTMHDKKLFDKTGVEALLKKLDGTYYRVLADSGYQGIQRKM